MQFFDLWAPNQNLAVKGALPPKCSTLIGQFFEKVLQTSQIGQGSKTSRTLGRFCVIKHPVHLRGDMCAPAACGQHWQNVGFQRIADHQSFRGTCAMACKGFCISRLGLVRHDLDRVEQIAQAGLGQLSFLVEQLSLGDEQDTVMSGGPLDCLARMGQQVDGVCQHFPPRRDDLRDCCSVNPAISHLDGRLDHRQGKAFDAETVVTKVALFGGKQAVMKMLRSCYIGQKRREMVLRLAVVGLVVPKRVVGIKTYGCQFHGRIFCLNQCPLSPFSRAGFALYSAFANSDPNLICNAGAMTLMRTPFLMSGKTDGNDGDTSVVTKTRTRTERPPLYKVLLLNDDYTPMEFVVHVLERFFGLTHAQAFEIMLTVHKKGLAVVGVFSFEVAETKVAQVMDFARRHQHPLQCTMEKE